MPSAWRPAPSSTWPTSSCSEARERLRGCERQRAHSTGVRGRRPPGWAWRVSDSELHVRRTEGEDLPVVLVHGAMDRNTSFAKVAELLVPRPVVRYDRRGYGRSQSAGTGDLATHVADLLAILDGRPAVLVGHSFGGLVALGAAAAAPELVPALGTYEAPVPWADWWPR